MVAEKTKKPRIAERGEEEEDDHYDGALLVSIEKLQEIQDELEKVNEEASDKVLEVEQKYTEIRRPVYKKRNVIIQNIPDFWLTAFLSHPALADLLTEDDQKIFKYLVSLDVEDFKDVKSGYTITFNFSPNPYFEDTKLTKTFSFSEEEGTTNISAIPIKWKKGMNIANGVDHEKKENKRTHADQSFFSWFSETDGGFMDEVADIIKEDLWPNPLKYFNNEADVVDFDDDEDDQEADEDFDVDEDDDEGKGLDGIEEDDEEEEE